MVVVREEKVTEWRRLLLNRGWEEKDHNFYCVKGGVWRKVDGREG